MVDPRAGDRAGPAHDAVHLVPFGQQQFGEVRTILARDTGDQCGRHVRRPNDRACRASHGQRPAGRGTSRRSRGFRRRDRSAAPSRDREASTMSSTLRGVPSGLDGSKLSSASGLTTSRIFSASSRIDRSTPVPTLMCSSSRVVLHQEQARVARSSTWRNSRIGDPVPHTSTSRIGWPIESWNLRISAGSTWLDSRSKLSPGP